MQTGDGVGGAGLVVVGWSYAASCALDALASVPGYRGYLPTVPRFGPKPPDWHDDGSTRRAARWLGLQMQGDSVLPSQLVRRSAIGPNAALLPPVPAHRQPLRAHLLPPPAPPPLEVHGPVAPPPARAPTGAALEPRALPRGHGWCAARARQPCRR